MEARGSSESSVTLFQSARRHVRIIVTGPYIISKCNLHDVLCLMLFDIL
jgi:hypothetical protein